MTLIPTQLGTYAIERELGRGGMGVVYLGLDTKLDRPVAIKALPEHLAGDPERLSRFQREAKLLASLTHPNIAGVYGLEEHDGAHYLVMEFVEGESLAQIIERGPLAIDESIRIGAQVAAGVEAAHEAGVIHRDLKPGNIVVTPQGKAKVLDFGLAKEVEPRGTSLDLSHSPTATYSHTPSHHTAQGQIMGTAAYLSPEQARGKQLDKRTDIWSFGCVLFECLTGTSPFRGETSTDSLGAILHKEPEWALLPPSTPAMVQLLLKRCLAKDSTRRLRDIGDARVELEEMLLDPSATSLRLAGVALSEGERKHRHSPSLVPWTVAAVLAIGGGFAAWSAWLTPEPRPQAKRLLVEVGSEVGLQSETGAQFAISPDGATLVFLAGSDGNSASLYLRSLDQLDATLLAGTNGAEHPFFSPDGQWIGFFAKGKLKKVSVTGGAPFDLCDAGGVPRGATWGDDGTIVFAPGTSVGLSRVRDTGGTPEVLTEPDREAKERSHRWPHMLPGSKALLFTSQKQSSTFDEANIEVLDLTTLVRRMLYAGASNPRYTASGHILFGRQGTLYAAPFDAQRAEMLDQPSPIIAGIVTEPPNGGVQLAISNDGTLIFNSGEVISPTESLAWVDRAGVVTPLDPTERDIAGLSISPDGSRLALQHTPDGQNSWDIWILEIERQVLSRLTFGEGSEFTPVWSPDSQQIIYSSVEGGVAPNLFIKRADGSDQPTRLTTYDDAHFPSDWSPDGNIILFSEQGGGDLGWDIMTLDLIQDPPEQAPFIQTSFNEGEATFSPNGKWVAYTSTESGTNEVYVRAFPGPGGRWQVSTSGGIHPIWSPDGTALYFIDGQSVMSASVVTDSEVFSVGQAEELFSPGPAGEFWYPRFDVMPEGDRFVKLHREGETVQQEQHTLTFVFNWFEELRERVGEGGR